MAPATMALATMAFATMKAKEGSQTHPYIFT
eukprot:CAMPEP_0174723602 /NCGR_PEP_ID=MMETSP1094-20130205/41416_1 /TAXON_ID=156173 /ORGANISM="Chrysochromulina brevifilum, Strain UTEX LB 985" /LENGTH=30 /DNA_ID= /DNA_START= /DNA_END= /DNA_ORIENTATION=